MTLIRITYACWKINGNIVLKILPCHQLNKTTRLESSLRPDLKFLVSDIGKMMTGRGTCMPVERSWPWGWKPWGINFSQSGQRQGKKSVNSAEQIILCSVWILNRTLLPVLSSYGFYLALCNGLSIVQWFTSYFRISISLVHTIPACWKSEQ